MSLYLFISAFFLIYGGMHLYLINKARAAYRFGSAGLPIIVFMAIMVVSPFIIRFLEKKGIHTPAIVLSYIGYIWLSFVFLFLSTSILIDIYHGVIHIGGLFLRAQILPFMPKRLAFILPSIISITLTTYGYFEALNIKAERLEIRTNKLKEKIRIAQISDLHIGLIVREERLKKIIDIILKESPDMVVSTGDLVDGQIDGLEGLNGLLREINPPLGKYAVVGNHEYYAGFEKALAFTQRAGFRVLRDELIDINGKILVAGVDDPQAKAYGLWRGLPERAIFSGLPKDRFVLLLKHRPRVESEGLFDLQLSGHVHNGQIFPFRLITKLAYPYLSGLYEFGSSLLYVSRGSGTWGPPVRVLSPPEVTIIDLIPLEPSGN